MHFLISEFLAYFQPVNRFKPYQIRCFTVRLAGTGIQFGQHILKVINETIKLNKQKAQERCFVVTLNLFIVTNTCHASQTRKLEHIYNSQV